MKTPDMTHNCIGNGCRFAGCENQKAPDLVEFRKPEMEAEARLADGAIWRDAENHAAIVYESNAIRERFVGASESTRTKVRELLAGTEPLQDEAFAIFPVRGSGTTPKACKMIGGLHFAVEGARVWERVEIAKGRKVEIRRVLLTVGEKAGE